MNSDLPAGLSVYKRTPTFTEDNLPRGLTADHATKESVWGLIKVEEGRLLYTVTDLRRPYREQLLLPDSEPGVVEPTIVHRVSPMGRVRFHVEFWRSECGQVHA